MRFHVQKGEPSGNCAHAIVDTACLGSQTTLCITSEEKRYLEEKLYDGYFAFEASTVRDWDDGICGVAPVFQSGDGNSKNCTPLKRNQVKITETLRTLKALEFGGLQTSALIGDFKIIILNKLLYSWVRSLH